MSQKISIRQYNKADYVQWNNFVSESANGIFLFHRDFLEHHQHKFEDFSVIIENESKWLAILPANKIDNLLNSHGYLTFGGLVVQNELKQIEVIEIFRNLLIFLESQHIYTLHLKILPTMYCKKPCEDIDYAIWIAKGQLATRKCAKVIDLKREYKISKTRQECIRRGFKNGLEIREESNFEPFWTQVLEPNMMHRHAAKPIHTCAEITFLKQKFPDVIRHFNVYHDHKIVAGTTVFITNKIAYPQHISALENKNELGSIDFLYNHLLKNVFSDYDFFAFGTSNNDTGTKIDANLLFWKESYGTQTVVHDSYEIPTKNHVFLNDFLL